MGAFSFRFTPETRELFPTHVDFFDALLPSLRANGLDLLMGAAGNETSVLVSPDGETIVNFSYAIDDNRDPDDGRIIQTDRFVYRGDKIRAFYRDFQFNQQGNDATKWDQRVRILKALDLPGRDTVKRFADEVGRSFSRPLRTELRDAIKTQGEYLGKGSEIFLAKFPDWKLKLADPQNHLNLIPRGDRLEIRVSLVLDDNKDPPDGRIFLEESLLVDPQSGNLIAHRRTYRVAPEVKGDLRVQLDELAGDLNRRLEFGSEGAEAFLKAIRSAALAPLASDLPPIEYFDYHIANASPALPTRPATGFDRLGARRREVFQNTEVARRQGEQFRKIIEEETGPLPEGHELRAQIERIAAEPDAMLRDLEWLRFARDQLWLSERHARSSDRIAAILREEPEVAAEAVRLQRELRGEAGFGVALETTARQFTRDSTSTVMIAGMMAAAFAGPATEALALRGLGGTRPGRWLASAIGLGGESFGLAAAEQIFSPEGGAVNFSQRFAANCLMFGGLRVSHNLAAWSQVRMAEGRFGLRWGGVSKDQVGNTLLSSPLGRHALGAWGPQLAGPSAALTGLGRFANFSLTHGGAVVMTALAQDLGKQWLGMPGASHGWFADLGLAGLSYLHGLAGFQLADRMTGSRLFSFLGDARYRLTRLRDETANRPMQIRPEIIEAPAVKPKARENLRKTIPDARLIEAKKWEEHDLEFGDPGRIFLDSLLFLRPGETVEIKRDLQGQFVLRDHRPDPVPAGGTPNFDIAAMPLLLNKDKVPHGQDVALKVGDELNFVGRRFYFGFPKSSPLGIAFSMAPPEVQINVSEAMDRADDLGELLAELHAKRFAGAEPLHAQLSDVLLGRQSIFQLPSEWRIFEKIRTLLSREILRIEQEGFAPSEFQLKSVPGSPRYSEIEGHYQNARAIAEWRESLRRAVHWDGWLQAIADGPFAEIESVPVAQIVARLKDLRTDPNKDWGPVPVVGGLRQQARDRLEHQRHEAYWQARQAAALPYPSDPDLKREVIKLDNARQQLLAQTRQSAETDGTIAGLGPDEIEERSYQVLERGRPIALVPADKNIRHDVEYYQTRLIRIAEKYFSEEMKATVNRFNGEKLDGKKKDSQYRLALGLLNEASGRLPLGAASLAEKSKFIEWARRALEPDLPEDYLAARAALRRHLELGSAKMLELISKSGLEEKAMLLENYFGDSRVRELPLTMAFSVAALLGFAGMYRELGVSYEIDGLHQKALLIMGDPGSVGTKRDRDFFLLHSHSEEYMSADGKTLGANWFGGGVSDTGAHQAVAMKPTKIHAESRDVLPSVEDLNLYLGHAKAFFQLRSPLKVLNHPFFSGNTFKTWIVHPLGLTEARVHLNDQGQASKIALLYAFRRRAADVDRGYLAQKEVLEQKGREMGIPIEINEMVFSELAAGVPSFAKFSLSWAGKGR